MTAKLDYVRLTTKSRSQISTFVPISFSQITGSGYVIWGIDNIGKIYSYDTRRGPGQAWTYRTIVPWVSNGYTEMIGPDYAAEGILNIVKEGSHSINPLTDVADQIWRYNSDLNSFYQLYATSIKKWVHSCISYNTSTLAFGSRRASDDIWYRWHGIPDSDPPDQTPDSQSYAGMIDIDARMMTSTVCSYRSGSGFANVNERFFVEDGVGNNLMSSNAYLTSPYIFCDTVDSIYVIQDDEYPYTFRRYDRTSGTTPPYTIFNYNYTALPYPKFSDDSPMWVPATNGYIAQGSGVSGSISYYNGVFVLVSSNSGVYRMGVYSMSSNTWTYRDFPGWITGNFIAGDGTVYYIDQDGSVKLF